MPEQEGKIVELSSGAKYKYMDGLLLIYGNGIGWMTSHLTVEILFRLAELILDTEKYGPVWRNGQERMAMCGTLQYKYSNGFLFICPVGESRWRQSTLNVEAVYRMVEMIIQANQEVS